VLEFSENLVYLPLAPGKLEKILKAIERIGDFGEKTSKNRVFRPLCLTFGTVKS